MRDFDVYVWLETARDIRTPRVLGRYTPSASLLIPGYGFTAHSRGLLASLATRKQISSSADCKHLYDDSAHLVLSLFSDQFRSHFGYSPSQVPASASA